jgi:NAD(P)-dependent dehydrogenase (short-subunit alcohol dehydrogenase family)
MGEFDGKVVFITGGTSGIGRGTAVEFAKRGAKVAFTGRREKEGSETLKAIQSAGGKGLFIKSDVSDVADAEKALKQAADQLGAIEIAFNNAGIEEEPTPFLDQELSVFDNIMQVNVRGMWVCLHAQIKHMVQHDKGGSIINNASVAGLLGMAGVSSYTASKHAVIGLTKSLAAEFAKKRIRVNAVAPGPIQTEMFDRFINARPQVKAYIEGNLPMARIGTVEEVASCVLWLASPTASYVTGQTIAIDGGMVVT